MATRKKQNQMQGNRGEKFHWIVYIPSLVQRNYSLSYGDSLLTAITSLGNSTSYLKIVELMIFLSHHFSHIYV